jgi:hypothetical protein
MRPTSTVSPHRPTPGVRPVSTSTETGGAGARAMPMDTGCSPAMAGWRSCLGFRSVRSATSRAPLGGPARERGGAVTPPEALEALRLHSVAAWDVELLTPAGAIHILASHATPCLRRAGGPQRAAQQRRAAVLVALPGWLVPGGPALCRRPFRGDGNLQHRPGAGRGAARGAARCSTTPPARSRTGARDGRDRHGGLGRGRSGPLAGRLHPAVADPFRHRPRASSGPGRHPFSASLAKRSRRPPTTG